MQIAPNTAKNVEKLDAMKFLTKLNNVTKISFTKSGTDFVINNPVCYYNEDTKTHIFLGEPKPFDPNAQANQILNMIQNMPKNMPDTTPVHDTSATFNEEDVKTIASQANVSEEEARQALIDKQGNVVEALLVCKK
ncbi:NAC domain-containing protein [Spironucleus salmonicida]|uniref:NAC domain-containing protein n=1 Tax=Spironucleus salmonicida TaxID=348837 RepID=V6LSM3_9EUKA|nr:NAC domain-containing protein [Spironucleus salmonicida]|eukprot:EST47610.1 NAC domain-containing protein [Spironucleus salmonicida]